MRISAGAGGSVAADLGQATGGRAKVSSAAVLGTISAEGVPNCCQLAPSFSAWYAEMLGVSAQNSQAEPSSYWKPPANPQGGFGRASSGSPSYRSSVPPCRWTGRRSLSPLPAGSVWSLSMLSM